MIYIYIFFFLLIWGISYLYFTCIFLHVLILRICWKFLWLQSWLQASPWARPQVSPCRCFAFLHGLPTNSALVDCHGGEAWGGLAAICGDICGWCFHRKLFKRWWNMLKLAYPDDILQGMLAGSTFIFRITRPLWLDLELQLLLSCFEG